MIRERSPSKNILLGQICYRVGNDDDCEDVSQPKSWPSLEKSLTVLIILLAQLG